MERRESSLGSGHLHKELTVVRESAPACLEGCTGSPLPLRLQARLLAWPTRPSAPRPFQVLHPSLSVPFQHTTCHFTAACVCSRRCPAFSVFPVPLCLTPWRSSHPRLTSILPGSLMAQVRVGASPFCAVLT